jgi:hypothetical protein
VCLCVCTRVSVFVRVTVYAGVCMYALHSTVQESIDLYIPFKTP